MNVSVTIQDQVKTIEVISNNIFYSLYLSCLYRNVHWMVLYQICVFGADLKSNMAARIHNGFSLAEILKIFLSETTKSVEL
jgi:hypothetical protein